MKCWKKVTAALMAALALVGMTGCAKPSPGQLITGAQQRMAKVNSMRMTMDIKLELAEELSAVGLSMTMDADIIQKPEAKTKASLQINSFMDAAVLEMYSWTQDGTQYVGISADGTNWQKTKALENPGASSVQALDPSQMGEMLNSYLDSLKNFVIEGEEQIEGKDAYKITGKISAEEIKNMMSSVSQGMDIPLSGEIPISIWIGKKDGLPLQYYIDLASLINPTAQEATGESAELVKEFSMTITIPEYGIADFEIPAQVQNASETGSDGTQQTIL